VVEMKTTKENIFEKSDLELFKKEAEHWSAFFGLMDFDLQISMSDKNDDSLAYTVVSHQDKIAIIKVSKCWDELTEYKIRETAFHEICEVLISRLRSMACGTFSDDAVNETAHSIILRLQNSIFKVVKPPHSS
jgi:hypothetical protein